MNIVRKIAVAATLLCAATVANAQDEGMKIGARLGYNMQMMGDADMGLLGFSGGVAFSIPAGPVVIAPELAFMYRENYSTSILDVDASQTEMAVSVPVLVKFFPIQGLYLQAGVQVDIPIASEYCVDDACVAMDGKEYFAERAAIDLGIPLGIGYMIMPNLSVDFRYVLGLMPHNTSKISILGASTEIESDPLSSMSLGVTYFF